APIPQKAPASRWSSCRALPGGGSRRSPPIKRGRRRSRSPRSRRRSGRGTRAARAGRTMREHGAQAAEELPVLVVGAGFAGVAAASAARRGGARVRVVSAGAGASELYSGLLDGAPSPAIAEVASALGLVPYRSPRAVATREGLVRTALGRDRAVLDLEALSGRTIAVVDLARDDFDAALLAKSLEASAWARSTRTTFRPVPVAALERGAERRFPPYDFARALENPERVREL